MYRTEKQTNLTNNKNQPEQTIKSKVTYSKVIYQVNNFAKRVHITKNEKAYTNLTKIEAQVKKLHKAYFEKFNKKSRLTKLVIIMEYYDIENKLPFGSNRQIPKLEELLEEVRVCPDRGNCWDVETHNKTNTFLSLRRWLWN